MPTVVLVVGAVIVDSEGRPHFRGIDAATRRGRQWLEARVRWFYVRDDVRRNDARSASRRSCRKARADRWKELFVAFSPERVCTPGGSSPIFGGSEARR